MDDSSTMTGGDEDKSQPKFAINNLSVDTSRECQPLCEALSSGTDSFSSFGDQQDDGGSDLNSPFPNLPPSFPASGLSAYLEDIVSDEEPMMDDMDTTPPPENHLSPASALHSTPSPSPPPLPPPTSPPPPLPVPPSPPVQLPPPVAPLNRPSKDELLQMMEKVDRSIATVEQQINTMERKQQELMKLKSPTTLAAMATPSPFTVSSLLSSKALTDEETSSPPSSPSSSSSRSSPKRSLVDTIYADNKIKARAAQALLLSLAPRMPSNVPLYYQPCEAPCYQQSPKIHNHELFRTRLLKYARRKHLARHKMEVELCKQYDAQRAEWERKVYRWETSSKKKARDTRNRELFEKLFPELRTKRDQLKEQAERFSRGGMRAFGFVRSEAELDQLAYELYEQEEAMDRHRRTHASIPSMVTNASGHASVEYINSNGIVRDPMALHREEKVTNIWTEEEKRTFREKFALFPKNFEKIAACLPRKSISDCVRHYYLAKKGENFKQMMRARKRRQTLGKPQDMSRLNSPLLFGHSKQLKSIESEIEEHTSFSNSLPLSEQVAPNKLNRYLGYDGWTETDISNLKEGLRKYGRAWGKVYREVGNSRTASQCKQFYDDYCHDKRLQLNLALEEHSMLKNAEKAKRKAELKRSISVPSSTTLPSQRRKHAKMESPKLVEEQEEEEKEEEEEEESESDSGREHSDSDEGSGESRSSLEGSDSESTITDSETEEPRSKKPALQSLKFRQVSDSSEPVQSPLDLFLLAVETMNNKIDPKVALHDHTYARPPMDLEGSSGLQLIAAAAAVVSPGLSRSAAIGKAPVLSPVKAPRGRPPSQQRRGSSHSGQKLAPTFLTPTSGSSQHVSLQDKPQLRPRSRSASTEKSRPTINSPRPLLSLRSGTCQSSGGLRQPQVTFPKGKDVGLIAPGLLKSNGSGGGQSTGLDALVAITTPPGDTAFSSANTSLLTQPLLATTSSSKGVLTTNLVGAVPHQRKDGNNAVLELNLNSLSSLGNLGNMLLLAATSGGNQTALLLPTLGKLPTNVTLASLLQSGNAVVSLSDSSGHGSQSIGITQAGSQSGNAVLHIPKITSDILAKSSSITLPVSFSSVSSSSSSSSTPSTPASESIPLVNPTIPVCQAEPTTKKLPLVSSDSSHTSQSSSCGSVKSSSAPATAAPTPTSEDFSNLNLLSSLVAGLSPCKPDPNSTSSSHPPLAPRLTASSASPSPSCNVTATGPDTSEHGNHSLNLSTSSSSSRTLSSNIAVSSFSQTASSLCLDSVSTASTKSLTSQDQPVSHTTTHSSTHVSRDGLKTTSSSIKTESADTKSKPTSLPLSQLAKSSEERDRQSQSRFSSTNSREWKSEERSDMGHSTSVASLSKISQQSLMLYTSSLSLPKHSPTSNSPDEEEDHLEYATRGISELSKLLGTDNGLESPASDNSNNNSYSTYKTSLWNPDDLLVNPLHSSSSSMASSSSFQTNSSHDMTSTAAAGLGNKMVGIPEDPLLFRTPSLNTCSHTNTIVHQQ